MNVQLTVKSNNPDYCGTWDRDEVKKEMSDLGYSGNWLEWVFDHNFDDYPTELLHMLQLSCLHDVSVSLDLDGEYTVLKLTTIEDGCLFSVNRL